MKAISIDLKDFRTPNSKVFTGRDRGIQVRNDSNIDALEKQCDKLNVIVPQDIRSINPSFLEEFLYNIVIRLGEKEFNNKVFFITSGRYDIQGDLEEAVESILREESALI